MKQLFIFAVLALSVAVLPGCKKKTTDTSSCSNGVQDNDETEIDCGGASCTACPPAPVITANVIGTDLKDATTDAHLAGNIMRLSAYSNQGIVMQVIYNQPALNQPEFMNSGSFTFNDHYIIEPGDSGVITITALDTVRHITSGNFYFTGTLVGGTRKGTVDSAVFTNVRYKLD